MTAEEDDSDAGYDEDHDDADDGTDDGWRNDADWVEWYRYWIIEAPHGLAIGVSADEWWSFNVIPGYRGYFVIVFMHWNFCAATNYYF